MKKFICAQFVVELILEDGQFVQAIVRDRNGAVCDCVVSLDGIETFFAQILDEANKVKTDEGQN